MSKTISLIPLVRDLLSSVIMLLFFLAFYLLALGLATSLLLTILFGMPVAILFSLLLKKQSVHHHVKMAIVMFAVGGFGMMLGCNADLGRTGLLSLLSMCQSTPLSLVSGPEQVWLKILLTPWTYIGMFIGGNLAMLSIRELRPGVHLSWHKTLYLYTACNIGMLIGMLMGEAIAIQLGGNINQFIAAGLMVALMLVGMSLGMILMLAVSESKNQRSSAAF